MAKSGNKSGTKKETRAESDHSQERAGMWMLAILQSGQTIRALGYCAAAVLVAVFGLYLPVVETAGKETAIKNVIEWTLKADVSVYVSWAVGAAGVGYGLAKRRQLHKERHEKDARIAELELQIDPNRTSSNLLPSGEDGEAKP